MVAAAIGVSAAAGLAGSAIASSGAKSAANTQADAQNNASAQQMAMFNTINGQEQPFTQAGYGATSALNQLLGLTSSGAPTGGLPNGYLSGGMPTPQTAQTVPTFNASTVTNSPGYQFAQQQGLSQVANAEAPNVGALSGPALKALTNFASGTAAQYYNDYFNQANTTFNQGTTAFNEGTTAFNQQQSNQQNIFSRLSAIAGLGQNAASNTGTAGTQLGTGAAQATAAAGASQAAGTVGSANAISGGISNAGNSFALNSILSNNTNANNGSADAGVPGWTPAQGGA
jgi:hypothetical protein